MSSALIVGGDQIAGIKQVLHSRGIVKIRHWSGRKAGDGKKVIPHDIELIVLVTDWISHPFMHKVKQTASRRGVRIVYTPNGPAALRRKLDGRDSGVQPEAPCRQCRTSFRLVQQQPSSFHQSTLQGDHYVHPCH